MRTAPLLAAVALLATAAGAGAQATDDPSALDRPVRGLAGGSLYYARPIGEFADYIRRGFGGSLHGTLLLDETGVLGLRFDASYMNYGRETVHDVCALPTNCRVFVDVTTTNNIAFVGAGPQLVAPSGEFDQYFGAVVGQIHRRFSASLLDLVRLWGMATPLPDVRTLYHPEWQTSAGARLRFDTPVTPCSDFDALHANDWHPADAATWDWLTGSEADDLGGPAATPRTIPSVGRCGNTSVAPSRRASSAWCGKRATASTRTLG